MRIAKIWKGGNEYCVQLTWELDKVPDDKERLYHCIKEKVLRGM